MRSVALAALCWVACDREGIDLAPREPVTCESTCDAYMSLIVCDWEGLTIKRCAPVARPNCGEPASIAFRCRRQPAALPEQTAAAQGSSDAEDSP